MHLPTGGLAARFKCVIFFTLILAGLQIFTSWQSSQAAKEVQAATLNRYQSYLLADELRQSSDDLTRLARTYVVSGEPKWETQYWEILGIRNGQRPRPAHYERIYWDFRAVENGTGQPMGEAISLRDLMARAGFTTEEFALLKQAQNNSDELVRAETTAMNLVKGLRADAQGKFTLQGDPDLETARNMMHDTAYYAYKAKIMEPLNNYLIKLDNRTQAEVSIATEVGNRWATASLVMAIAIGVVLAVLLFNILRWLTKALGGEPSTMRRVAEAVAAGKLDTPIHLRPGDRLSVMASLSAMRDGLVGIVVNVRKASDNIASGTAEISSGNNNLDQRTESQANNLQRTASSMEQLGTTVRTSAATAAHANELAASASAAAVKGGEVVSHVVGTMQDIAASSKKIADIIGVIDAIAFQTNILALNAAVEAARAGEQGRGFAVVASEVRHLAGRSANAAKEIKALISSSVARVDTGARQVNEAGASMNEIVAQVQRVSNLIHDISKATLEQSQGIDEVGVSVGNLDRATQENAALVKESAAAADNLRAQAMELAQMVNIFKLGNSSAALGTAKLLATAN